MAMRGTLPCDFDVLVIGAGPGGVAAGIEATRLGRSTLVVDKARFPRDKTCGDGLTTGALRQLDTLGLDVRKLPSYVSVRQTVIVGPDGREVSLPLPDDGEHAGVVPRRELDAALGAAGAQSGHRPPRRRRPALGEHGPRRGRGDPRRRHRGARAVAHRRRRPLFRRRGDCSHADPADVPDLGTWHAFRQYFRGVDDPRLWVLFERDLLPGYAWVFPVGGGRANVGFGVLRDDVAGGKRLAALWRDVLARPSVRRILGDHAEPDGPHRAWPIPAAWSEAALTSEPRALFVGDAAGVVDPMTGEGIAQALETGTLAARAVAYGGHPSNVAAQYRTAVRDALGTDLRFAGALQRVLRSPVGARAALGAAGLTPWTRRNFARWMFEDYPRAIVLTPQRWRAGMFTRSGAYGAA